MLSAGFITDADLEVAIHNDPSTDHVVWQQCAETIDEYFGPSGTFWSEPITSSGEYVVENNMSMSGEASSEFNTGLDIDMSSSIGGAMNDLDINYSSNHLSEHPTTVNATPQYRIPHQSTVPQPGFHQHQDPGSCQNKTYNSSPPTVQQTKHGPVKYPSPTVEVKQPAKNKKMPAELSYPITPQLGTPYVRGRITRSTKGAKELRREMEEQELVDTLVKSAHDNLKRKNGAETPVRPRKQPKRAAKNKKK